MAIEGAIEGMVVFDAERAAGIKVQGFGVLEVAGEVVGLHLVGDVVAVTTVVDTGGVAGAVERGVDFEFEVGQERGTGFVTQRRRTEIAGGEFAGGIGEGECCDGE